MHTANKCPSCGGLDHARASSNKCLNKKRRVREEAVPSTHELRPYTIKKCFRGFVRHDNGTGLKDLLVREVRRDVQDLSGLAIEISLSFFCSGPMGILSLCIVYDRPIEGLLPDSDGPSFVPNGFFVLLFHSFDTCMLHGKTYYTICKEFRGSPKFVLSLLKSK